MVSNITLKQMSHILGISVSTVSKSLSNSDEISERTKQRVFAIAEHYNYRPNSLAQNLRLQKSNTIGLIVPDLNETGMLALADSISDHTMKRGLKLMLYQSKGMANKEKILIKLLTNGCTDGLIIFLSEDTLKKERIEPLMDLAKTHFPLVLLNDVEGINCHKVCVPKNNEEESRLGKEVFQLLGAEAVRVLKKTIDKKETSTKVHHLSLDTMLFEDDDQPKQEAS